MSQPVRPQSAQRTMASIGEQQQQRWPLSIVNAMQLPSSTSCASSATATSGKQMKLKQRFTVIRKLGKGTYGKVQLAINKETGQEVAIKTIKKTKIENEQDLQRVRREIQIMSSIEHPHIIHIYEVFENKDKIVLIMQYAPGGELYEYVSQSKVLDDTEARRLFRQIATAIYYCHQNKICHRDLKLENILLDEKNNAKIADFGLSNVFDKKRQLRTFCGSPLYASPEIVQGSPYEGPEVDCWSLGVLLYTLVYGSMPFDGSNFKRLVKQISEAKYYEPTQRSQASPLIGRLLCANPLKRATILDICSDPWVNGSSSLDSSPQAMPPRPGHNHLLKVAQDMASLTPVRLDLLLALNPSSQPGSAQICNGENSQTNDFMQKDTSHPPEKPTISSLSADTSSLDLPDDGRAGSPVANYVVRDLTTPNGSIEPDFSKDQSMADESKSVQKTEDDHLLEIEPKREKIEVVEVEMKPERQESLAFEMDHENMTPETKPSQVKPLEPVADVTPVVESEASKMEVDEPQEQQGKASPDAANIAPETVDANMGKIKFDEALSSNDTATDTAKPGADQTELEASEKTSEAQEPGKQEAPDLERQEAAVDEMRQETVETGVEKADKENNQESSDKPKKKKKVVVVKKKKRISKKEPGPKNVFGSQAEQPDQESTKSEGRRRSETPTTEQTGSKGPGKLKIPDTFQADKSSQNGSQSTSKEYPVEARRTSALINDVSQRLTQPQQQQGNSQSFMMEDQSQLAKVRVSDKKEEFERRKSGVSSETSETAAQEISKDKVKSIQQELLRHNATEEPLIHRIERPVTEVIKVNQPHCATLAPKVQNSGVDSEPVTPKAETETKVEFPDRQVPVRSDSAETIKSEGTATKRNSELGQPKDKVMCTRLEINLDNQPVRPDDSEDSQTSSVQDQPIARPVPITRSYKKITFTKDGTSITETGKIYSTKGDDGTIRRMERRSKVTHYPSDNSSGSGPRQEARQEEIIYETGDGFGSSSGRKRPFERLIMPSPDNPFDTDRHRGPFEQSQGTGSASIFGSRRPFQQMSRADSASSCSSSSTDIFDDIFDTWTGATNIFGQNRNMHEQLENLMSRDEFPMPFGPSIMSSIRRRRDSQNDFNDSKRCSSVEPSELPDWNTRDNTKNRRRHDRYGDTSGYESDAPQQRPASATFSRGAGLKGHKDHRSSNQFLNSPRLSTAFESPLLDDDLFGRPSRKMGLFDDSLWGDFERQHQSLRERIAQHHKKLWKGSTPSLFTNPSSTPPRPTQEGGRKPPTGPVRTEGFRYDFESGRRNANDQQIGSGQGVNQSQSSSSFKIRPSVALDKTPIRRNTATLVSNQLPPRQPLQRTISKTSLIKQMEDFNLEDSPTQQKTQNKQQKAPPKHTKSCFIELKRSPSGSNASTSAERSEKSHNSQTMLRASQHTSNSSSAKFDDRPPMALSSDSHGTANHDKQGQPFLSQDNVRDARIQRWLQNSSEDLSLSSGSKSSVSETQASGHGKGEKITGVKSQPTTVRAGSNTNSPVILQQQPKQPEPSAQSQRCIKSAKDTISTTGDSIFQQSERAKLQEKLVETPTSVSAQKVSQKILSMHQESPGEDGSCSSAHREQVVVQKTIKSSFVEQAIATPHSADAGTSGPLRWTSHTAGEDNFDTNDSFGGSAGELDSRSSSSLLEQLRTRGYRSMINQRLVSDLQHGTHQQQQAQMISSTSSTSSFTSGRGPAVRNVISTAAETDQFISSVTTNISSSSGNVAQTRVQSINSSIKEHSSLIKEQQPEAMSNGAIVNMNYLLGNMPPISWSDGAQDEDASNNDRDRQNRGDVIANELLDGNNNVIGNEQESTVSPGAASLNQETREDEDEDVKEAKANVKSYLDRVKETEKFLKSLQEVEDNLEIKRREMFVLDSLMLNAKLNGQCGPSIKNDMTSGYRFATNSPPYNLMDQTQLFGRSSSNMQTGPNTAPIMQGRMEFGHNYNHKIGNSIGYPANISNNLPYNAQNEFIADMGAPPRSLMNGMAFGGNFSQISPMTRMSVDPLDPVQPLYTPYLAGNYDSARGLRSKSPTFGWSRSRSQLGDDSASLIRRRPLSTNIDVDNNDSIYRSDNPVLSSAPLRSRRSISQVRYSEDNHSPPIMMSEYKSSFGPNLADYRTKRATSVAPNRSHPSAHISGTDTDLDGGSHRYSTPYTADIMVGDDDSDDGMPTYRAHSYVPKVVPSSYESRPSRRDKRYSVSSRLSLTDRSPSREFSSRRTSLQPTHSTRESITSKRYDLDDNESSVGSYTRRLSLTGDGDSISNTSGTSLENSRLSELEQRLQANKKRREELLMEARGATYNKLEARSVNTNRAMKYDQKDGTSQSATRRNKDRAGDDDASDDELMNMFERPNAPVAKSSRADCVDQGEGTKQPTSVSRFSRPSRLESMEARIKRKSYCVRVSSPEIARSSN